MDPATIKFLIEQAPLAAGAVFGIWMFSTGRWHSDREMTRAYKDLETERAAHEETRRALALASARADAGVRAAELVAHAVEGARNVPQTPAP